MTLPNYGRVIVRTLLLLAIAQAAAALTPPGNEAGAGVSGGDTASQTVGSIGGPSTAGSWPFWGANYRNARSAGSNEVVRTLEVVLAFGS